MRVVGGVLRGPSIGHALVQAAVGVGTVIIVFIGVAYTPEAGGYIGLRAITWAQSGRSGAGGARGKSGVHLKEGGWGGPGKGAELALNGGSALPLVGVVTGAATMSTALVDALDHATPPVLRGALLFSRVHLRQVFRAVH